MLAHITDFLPYFYVSVPRGFEESDMLTLKEHINNKIHPLAVSDIDLTKKRSLWGYRGDAKPLFLKLTISDQRTLPKVRGLFERGEMDYKDLYTEPVTTYESNIAYTLRFMIDCKVSAAGCFFACCSHFPVQVVGMNWIEVPGGKYNLVSPKDKSRRSTCQIEVEMRYDAFISHAPEGEWSKIAPLRILSFDIECAGRKGIFPEAEIDPVIQIANMVTRQGNAFFDFSAVLLHFDDFMLQANTHLSFVTSSPSTLALT